MLTSEIPDEKSKFIQNINIGNVYDREDGNLNIITTNTLKNTRRLEESSFRNSMDIKVNNKLLQKSRDSRKSGINGAHTISRDSGQKVDSRSSHQRSQTAIDNLKLNDLRNSGFTPQTVYKRRGNRVISDSAGGSSQQEITVHDMGCSPMVDNVSNISSPNPLNHSQRIIKPVIIQN